MNFSGWLKSKEDEKTVTMKHPSGHEMRIIKKSLPKLHLEALKRIKMSDGGSVNHYADGTPDAPISAPEMQPSQQADVQLQEPQPVPKTGTSFINDRANPIPGIDLEQQGNREKANIEGQISQQRIPLDEANIQQTRNIADQDVQDANEMSRNANETLGHSLGPMAVIKPNAYLENQSAGQKTTQALSLFLGGLGGGVSGRGGNVAQDFLDKQIDRNIAAQQQNNTNRMSVFHGYMDVYHNKNIATNLARIHQGDMLAQQSQLLTDKFGTSTADAQNKILQGQLAEKRNQLMVDTLGRLHSLRNTGATLGGGQNSPSLGVNTSMNGPRQALPTASVPVGVNQATAPPTMGQRADKFLMGDDEAQAGPLKTPQTAPDEDQILRPDWIEQLKSLDYTPKAKEQSKDITNNIERIQQSEKGLRSISEKFPRLKDEDSYSRWLAEKINPHAVGGALAAGVGALGAAGIIPTFGASSLAALPGAVGAGIGGEALGNMVKQGLTASAGQTGAQYDSDKSSLFKDIAVALHGANVSSEQIEDVVNKNTPTIWDDKETYDRKLSNIKQFIRNNTSTTLAEKWDLNKEWRKNK